MIEFILPVIFFIGIGFAAGGVLTLAGKAFEVKSDERVEKLLECLPGINCGACGFSGCEQYAELIISGKAKPNLCKPGSEKTALKIGEILGRKIRLAEKESAFVRCSGKSVKKYAYSGTQSCAASRLYYNGSESCRFGCMAHGDCAAACPENAIDLTGGVAVVNPDKCHACGMCLKTCPNNLIVMKKAALRVNVLCSSQDPAKITKAACSGGCIGCKICEKKCPKGAIKVKDKEYVATIDGYLCNGCGLCAEVCPVKCITTG